MPNFRHACPEWDFLEIDQDCPEFECCICEIDEDGKGPHFYHGDRVLVLPNQMKATVDKQYLTSENVWGNVLVRYDDGVFGTSNPWQLMKILVDNSV